MARLKCSIRGCKRPAKSHGWCSMHYHRWQRHGNPNYLGHRAPNKIVRRNGIVRIQIIRRDGTTLWARVDARDWERLNLAQYRWCVGWSPNNRTFYVFTNTPVRVKIHSLILPNASMVDHRDHDGLNNRRNNLRPATPTQNAQYRHRPRGKHSSRFKGVSRRNNSNGVSWRWEVCANGKRYTSTCKTEIEAARAAFDKRKQVHGKFKSIGRRP